MHRRSRRDARRRVSGRRSRPPPPSSRTNTRNLEAGPRPVRSGARVRFLLLARVVPSRASGTPRRPCYCPSVFRPPDSPGSIAPEVTPAGADTHVDPPPGVGRALAARAPSCPSGRRMPEPGGAGGGEGARLSAADPVIGSGHPGLERLGRPELGPGASGPSGGQGPDEPSRVCLPDACRPPATPSPNAVSRDPYAVDLARVRDVGERVRVQDD